MVTGDVRAPNIHPTASVDADASVDPSASVGAGTRIGPSVTIAPGVVVGANCAIGERPFDRSIDAESDLFGIVLEADVRIGSQTVIQYGTKRETVIGTGTWINTHCNIGHDVVIGADSMVGMSCSISGHSTLGIEVKVGPGCTLNNRSVVGDRSQVGIGALVLHEVPADTVVMGRPAEERAAHLEAQRSIRALIGQDRADRPITRGSQLARNRFVRAGREALRIVRQRG